QRVPPDHRQRVGDDLHRPVHRGCIWRSHSGWSGHVSAGIHLTVLVLDRRTCRRHHFADPMSFLTNMIKELRERKLWPIAIVLVVALVAVPVLLSKKAPTNLVTQPSGGLPYSTGTALPAITVETKQSSSKLAGRS